MNIRICLLVCLLAASCFSSPFFYRELKLQGATVSIVIDSIDSTTMHKTIFKSVDSLCPNKRYYYFSVKNNNTVRENKITIYKKSFSPGDTLTITYSGVNWNQDDTLNCQTTNLPNLSGSSNLNYDTTTLSWRYLAPVAQQLNVLSITQLNLGYQHLRITLRKGTDSTSITMTKGPIPYVKLLPTQYNEPIQSLNVATYSTLHNLQNSNDRVELFNISGRKIGNIINHKLTFTNKTRLTSGVLLYIITNKDGNVQNGKVDY